MWPIGGDYTVQSKETTCMVYVRYHFHLINFAIIVMISHQSRMCPSPFFSKFSLPRHDRDGQGLYQHCIICMT